MWEHKEIKGRQEKKAKVDPRVDMKLLPWRLLQGIKDNRLLIYVLSRVASKEFSLDEMVTEFQKYVTLICFSFFLCICFDN